MVKIRPDAGLRCSVARHRKPLGRAASPAFTLSTKSDEVKEEVEGQFLQDAALLFALALLLLTVVLKSVTRLLGVLLSAGVRAGVNPGWLRPLHLTSV